MHTQAIHILWDSSHIWGLMLLRALQTWQIPFALTKGKEIAKGLLLGKPETRLLIVPGGTARHKANALGIHGMEMIRHFVAEGGTYLGICGGAGLALCNSQGLCLCPWNRQPYSSRLQHLASGHVKAHVARSPFAPAPLHEKTIALPIWWPGRFSPMPEGDVEILASAQVSDTDFWLGDLPLESIPPEFFAIWREEYGVDLSSDFLHDTPLIITGTYGKGRYILSYSHLETPQSPHANLWLASLIAQATSHALSDSLLPPWNLDNVSSLWPGDSFWEPLQEAFSTTRALLDLGQSHHLFFRRTPWLWGWRCGLPGASLNSLHTAFATLFTMPPNEEAHLFWEKKRESFQKNFAIFAKGAQENLLTTRIVSALGTSIVSQKDLKERSQAIFGSARDGGGLLDELLDDVEELIYLAHLEGEYGMTKAGKRQD